ncbi:MAG: methylthioribulose 1-phosphate dehydratase, partial [Gemmataceae bacterium]|nr:methylthioribulose 1-phosphate dehydratase [Gemmataceae bacterium]
PSANREWGVAESLNQYPKVPGEEHLDGAIAEGVEGLRDAGRLFHGFKWSLGTSSNYSVVLQRNPLRLLLTSSGNDKRLLRECDFVVVDEHGKSLVDPAHGKPSAETGLHLLLAELPETGAVLHTHSVWSTLLTDRFGEVGFTLERFEMLKGLDGITTHEASKLVEVFANDQDITRLAGRVRARVLDTEKPLKHGFLLERHGLYAWGKSLAETRRHIEIFEFLFEVLGRKLQGG